MKQVAAFCSIHLYFRVNPEQMPVFDRLMSSFIERTQKEEGVMFYGFTCHGSEADITYLQGHLAHLNPDFYIFKDGFIR